MINAVTSESELLLELTNYYDELSEIGSQITESQGTACGDRCSFCCHLHITLKPYELLPIVNYINTLPESEQVIVRNQISINGERVGKASDNELLLINFQCPLLKDRNCSMYDIRPTACRIAHSQNRDLCEKAYHSPSLDLQSEHIPELITASRNCEALFEERLGEYHDVSRYNINVSLQEALADPLWIERFLQGDEVFSDDALGRV